jgi:flavodoxin
MESSRRTFLIGGMLVWATVACGQPAPSGRRILTACFSRTGNTRRVADHIHRLVGGDRFDIVPATAYPADYEATVEQARQERARDYHPPLRETMAALGTYDIVLLGHPIWAMTLPPVMRTFLSGHDLSSKTVAPFCTHKGYGRGESAAVIAKMAPRARLLDGFDIEGEDADTAGAAVERWLRTIDLIRA